jgi:hypothetical protein
MDRKSTPRKVSTRRCRSKMGDVVCALVKSASWPSEDEYKTGTETCIACGTREYVDVSALAGPCHLLGPSCECPRPGVLDPSIDVLSAIRPSLASGSESAKGGDLTLFRGGTTSRFWNALMGAEMEARRDVRDLRILRCVRCGWRDATYLQCVRK